MGNFSFGGVSDSSCVISRTSIFQSNTVNLIFFRRTVFQALTGQQHGVFLHRLSNLVRFSCQRALVNLQVVALDQDTISRQQVSCKQIDQIGQNLFPPSATGFEQDLTQSPFKFKFCIVKQLHKGCCCSHKSLTVKHHMK